MDDDQTIVILGGGVGGVVSAVELRKKLPKQHRIVLVDREEQHLFAPSLLWLMMGGHWVDEDMLGHHGGMMGDHSHMGDGWMHHNGMYGMAFPFWTAP